MKHLLAALILTPTLGLADGIKIEQPIVPLAPPGSMVHAVFMKITNTGNMPRQLLGAVAEGYHTAHIHLSEEKDGIVSMTAVDVIEIVPGQTVALEHGSFHIMLMRPIGEQVEGDTVTLTLVFANGASETVDATVVKMIHGQS